MDQTSSQAGGKGHAGPVPLKALPGRLVCHRCTDPDVPCAPKRASSSAWSLSWAWLEPLVIPRTLRRLRRSLIMRAGLQGSDKMIDHKCLLAASTDRCSCWERIISCYTRIMVNMRLPCSPPLGDPGNTQRMLNLGRLDARCGADLCTPLRARPCTLGNFTKLGHLI